MEKKRFRIMGFAAVLAIALFLLLRPTYKNQLPIAVDETGAVYNRGETPGYKADTYLEEGKETPVEGSCLTGYIPCKAGDVIRFRNLEYLDLSSTGQKTFKAGIYAYDSSLNEITHVAHNIFFPPGEFWAPVYGAQGNVVGLTMTDKWGDSVAYIRIYGARIGRDSIITVNEEITDNPIRAFFLKLLYPGSAAEQEISAPEATASAEAELQAQTGTLPIYWVKPLEAGARKINTALCEAGYNKSAFLFYTDIHWNCNAQVSPLLLKYLYQNTGINKTFFGGDIVSDEGTDYETMEYVWQWRSMIKDLPNHHSVTGNHDDGNETNHLFDEDYVYGFLLAPEETPDIVRGDGGLYYYIDNPSEKTRYLLLDTAFQTVLYDAAQMQFVVDALTGTPEGWHIVAISHLWYDTNYHEKNPTVGDLSYSGTLLLNVFDSYNGREAGSVKIADSNASGSARTKVDYDFRGCGARIEFCIGGHTHWDYDGSSPEGIPVILCETDSNFVRSGLGYEKGTTSEAAVSGIIADYDKRKISVIRVGRGESREILY